MRSTDSFASSTASLASPLAMPAGSLKSCGLSCSASALLVGEYASVMAHLLVGFLRQRAVGSAVPADRARRKHQKQKSKERRLPRNRRRSDDRAGPSPDAIKGGAA